MFRSNIAMNQAAVRLLGVLLMVVMALVGLVSPTHAEAVISGYTQEFATSFQLDSTCASSGQEESISVNLTREVQFFRVADAAGNYHWSISEQWKDVSAVGFSSGSNYQVHFLSRAMMNTGTAAREFTSIYQMMIVGPSGDSNVYTYTIQAHYTVNSDGSLANYTWNSINECR